MVTGEFLARRPCSRDAGEDDRTMIERIRTERVRSCVPCEREAIVSSEINRNWRSENCRIFRISFLLRLCKNNCSRRFLWSFSRNGRRFSSKMEWIIDYPYRQTRTERGYALCSKVTNSFSRYPRQFNRPALVTLFVHVTPRRVCRPRCSNS